MKQTLHREVVAVGATYELRLPWCYGAGDSAFLEDALLNGIAPASICLLKKNGVCEIIYRWQVKGAWVTLTTGRYAVVVRHPRRRRFTLTHNPDPSGAYPTTDAEAKVTVQSCKVVPRQPVWRQHRDELGSALNRLHELQAQVGGWLQGAETAS